MSDRLNKFLATHLGISRREADDAIADGKVLVNGKPAILGNRIENSDKVIFDGKPVNTAELIYLLFNKPVGYVSSRAQQGSTSTIYELLPPEYHSLKTVGRLDKDSSGLILLTNDGDFAFAMTHPKFYKNKTYQVSLDRPLEPLHQQMISDFGVTLPDGPSKLTLTAQDKTRKDWQVDMSEGRNRQIRRTFASLGYTVTALHRTHFGTYALADLKSGEWLTITK